MWDEAAAMRGVRYTAWEEGVGACGLLEVLSW